MWKQLRGFYVDYRDVSTRKCASKDGLLILWQIYAAVNFHLLHVYNYVDGG